MASRLNLTAALTATFNCFALNAALVLACLPVVTIPLALRAAAVALDRWREDGEDRVAREFIRALRSSRLGSDSAAVGGPLLATLLAAAEVRFFAHPRSPADWVCLGLGASGLLLSLASAAYATVLSARAPDLRPSEVWSAAATLTARHAVGASALLVGEIALSVALLTRDPALVVVCVPIGLVALVRLTAAGPIDRASATGARTSKRGGALSR